MDNRYLLANILKTKLNYQKDPYVHSQRSLGKSILDIGPYEVDLKP